MLTQDFHTFGPSGTRVPVPEADDLQRLRAEYARRKKRLIGKETYSAFNTANLFMMQQLERKSLRLLQKGGFFPLSDKRILEVGCGSGGVLLDFLTYGASPELLRGCDLLEDRIAEARKLLPQVGLECADAQSLPYPDQNFDLVLQYTVFTSILDYTVKANIAREMLRVLKPAGMILWWDFWLNPTNPQTRGIRPPEIRRLYPNCKVELHKITLAPPLARRLVPVSWLLSALLENLRFLNTHYLAAIRRVQESER